MVPPRRAGTWQRQKDVTGRGWRPSEEGMAADEVREVGRRGSLVWTTVRVRSWGFIPVAMRILSREVSSDFQKLL